MDSRQPTAFITARSHRLQGNSPVRQRGATMVEFSISLAVFLVLVLAIFEFVLMVLTISRANEVTRDLARIAIVSDPVCDIWGTDCPSGTALSCLTGAMVTTTLTSANNCSGDPTDTACRMLERARTHLPDINGDQIQVRYICSNAGLATRPEPVLQIIVALQNVTHSLALPGLLGLNPEIAIPSFETVRLSEDINTSQKRY